MTSAAMMRSTLLALTPGLVVLAWYFGPGILLNIVTASVAALATEALMLKLRKKSPTALLDTLMDGSALLTGVLLGLALPPLLPFWMVVLAAVFALIVGKHLYGGLGQNLFNPAMAGFAVLILSFPLAMSQWPPPSHVAPSMSAVAVIKAKWNTKDGRADHDGVTRATPLDAWKFRQGAATTSDEFFTAPEQANWQAWFYINLAFLAGGVCLLYLGVIPWQTPLSMLLVLGSLALLFYDAGSSSSAGSPVFHLLSGATMLAAFFIITDPVTCPALPTGLLVFGAGVAVITFIIRTIGAYPEGIAFGVLLMNACSPLIDHLLAPKNRPVNPA